MREQPPTDELRQLVELVDHVDDGRAPPERWIVVEPRAPDQDASAVSGGLPGHR